MHPSTSSSIVGRSRGQSGKRCVVFGCGNTNKNGVSLHFFPLRNNDLLKKWNAFVSMKRKNWGGATKHSVVCSKHFLDSCYPTKYKIMESLGQVVCRKDLLSDAIPTINTVAPSPTCSLITETPPPPPKKLRIRMVFTKQENATEEDIDIETFADVESDISECRTKMLTRTEKTAASPCSQHRLQLKRKHTAQIDPVENVPKGTIEFSEGLVYSSGAPELNAVSLLHISRERQRRFAISEWFRYLMETIYGQDDNGQDVPLPLEAIQGLSKITILQKAKSWISDLHLKSLEQEEKKRVLKMQNDTLIQRLHRARADLIQIGMPPDRLEDILAKIKKTCQIVFSKREAVMKKQLDTLKAAMTVMAKDNSTKTEKMTFKQEDVESLTSDTQVKQNSECSDNMPMPLKALINPMHAINDAPVPVQMISREQVLKMAEYNGVGQKSLLKTGNPELYMDVAEESSLNIKTEPVTEKPDQEMTELCTPVDYGSTTDGVLWSVVHIKTETEESYGDESDFQEKLVIPKASGSASVQSPVFSDVDESETLLQRLEDDFGEKD